MTAIAFDDQASPADRVTPAQFVQTLKAAGFTLNANGNRLEVSPAGLNGHQRAFIKANKRALVEALQVEVLVETLDDRITHIHPLPDSPAPVPAVITCGSCRHYLANPAGAGGIGQCQTGSDQRAFDAWLVVDRQLDARGLTQGRGWIRPGPPPPLYPNIPRSCDDFEEKHC
jgi:LSD1 subclass zinc finger protein